MPGCKYLTIRLLREIKNENCAILNVWCSVSHRGEFGLPKHIDNKNVDTSDNFALQSTHLYVFLFTPARNGRKYSHRILIKKIN